jgi:hypothetical protein
VLGDHEHHGCCLEYGSPKNIPWSCCWVVLDEEQSAGENFSAIVDVRREEDSRAMAM